MAKILQLRMLSDEKDDFIREYEVPVGMNLLDFHHYLSGNLNYDESVMASFFASDMQWDKLREYTLMDMGVGTLPMEQTTIGELACNRGSRFLYNFDIFRGRCLYIESGKQWEGDEKSDYPRTTLALGEPPEQFESDPDQGSIFDEALGDFAVFEGDDHYDD